MTSRPRGLEVVRSIRDLAPHEVERLLQAATGWSRDQLLAGRRPSAEDLGTFDVMLRRRRSGEPLQHIEGTCAFGPLTLRCDARALIPRPETEQLWEVAVAHAGDPPAIVVDVGTGTGCLALACKHVWPDAAVYATDTSRDAVALAVENVALTGLDVTLLEGALLDPVPERLRGAVDLIISNPPYLAAAELADLPVEVRDHEPVAALVSGPTGLEVLEQIATAAAEWLRPGGVVACEISEFRGEETAVRFAELGGEVRQDLTGRDRFVIGRRGRRDGALASGPRR